ncbi:hypothetical protein IQ273_12885 [Nodosilinea sp. LEGE 07298]|uniref:hypothetical protein n=1 Tax=Nodosilinea sp. LEGE 07298 TaxID=2777970 RepID=UPI0018828903|nr:hypothetical protein [Nodosilinea sp. LEGE 07298]MBE9110308.1 hypothetical protein [Nodosilinea sp. LEGE 07298]
MLDYDISDALYHIEIVQTTQKLQQAAAEAQKQKQINQKTIGLFGGEDAIEWETVENG